MYKICASKGWGLKRHPALDTPRSLQEEEMADMTPEQQEQLERYIIELRKQFGPKLIALLATVGINIDGVTLTDKQVRGGFTKEYIESILPVGCKLSEEFLMNLATFHVERAEWQLQYANSLR
jgi:hypothetical protein